MTAPAPAAPAPGVFSLEVFPPKTEQGIARLERELTQLAVLSPAYVSVTCTTGPEASDRTYRTVVWLRERLGADLDVVPHIVALGATRPSTRSILSGYRALGVRRLVVIRGDAPTGGPPMTGDFPHAGDLIAFIRTEAGAAFHIEAAAHPEFHPEAPSAEADLTYFAHKVTAGADSALTQCFFNADAYFSFVDSCRRRGLALPIVPGIMPIGNFERLVRFCASAGVEIPRWLRFRLDGLATDPGALIAFGVDVIGRLCERLLAGGAPGLHFYTMNRAEPTATLWTQLGLARPEPRPRGAATIPSPRVAPVVDPRARESGGSGEPLPTSDRDRLAPAPPARGKSRR
jgi:methylenetetrahydrofolate reductase (NADPH)